MTALDVPYLLLPPDGQKGGRGVVHLGPLRWWAERGLIHCEDGDDNTYRSFSVREILFRLQAMSDNVKDAQRRVGHDPMMDFHKIHELQNYIEGMVELCRRAREQGTPDDPTARADLKRRRPTSIAVPAKPSGGSDA